jgi:hypothetical protein
LVQSKLDAERLYTMNHSSRDRVLAVLNGEMPDRIPIFEYLIHDGVFDHYIHEAIKPGDLNQHIYACSKCLDLCHPVWGPHEPHAEEHSDGSKTIYERWMSWDVQKTHRSGDDMAYKKLLNKIEQLEDDITTHAKAEVQESANRVGHAAGDMIYIQYSCSAALPYDNSEEGIFLYSDYQDVVEKYVHLVNAKTLERLQATAFQNICPVAIIWDDLAYKNGLFYSRELLKKLFFKPLNEICSLFHSRGIKVVFHSDGDIREVLPDLAACGIDGFNPLEISSGMDYGDFKAKYGKKIALVGGMDAIDALAFGSVDDVIAETKRLIKIAGAGGGFIAASSSGQIDESMPTENVLAYFDTIQKFGRY